MTLIEHYQKAREYLAEAQKLVDFADAYTNYEPVSHVRFDAYMRLAELHEKLSREVVG